MTAMLVSIQGFAGTVGSPPPPATGIEEIERLPGVYKVAGRGGDVGDVYLVMNPEPVLIDCGSRVGWEQLTGNLKLLGLTPGDIRWVIATHGHWDHMDAMVLFQRDFPNVKFAVHASDAQFVIQDDRVFSCADPLYNGVESGPVKVDRMLLDGDTLEVGKQVFKIVHTPGHTPGSIVVLTEMDGKTLAFCGDSIGGYYALTNRSSTLDWQIALDRLLALDIDWVFVGHRKDPFTDKREIRDLIQRNLDAATWQRKLLQEDEAYQSLEENMRKGARIPKN